MKFTTKGASVLLAILVSSTIGGAVVSAADPVTPEEMAKARELTSKGTVTIKDAEDTGGPDTDGKVPDPEKPGKVDPVDPSIVDPNDNKGPIKVESISQLQFGEIQGAAKEIKRMAAPLSVKDAAGAETTRGNIVVFADVRSDVYGYDLQAKMSEQFTSGDNILAGSTIGFKNIIMTPESGNENTAGSIVKPTFDLGEGTDAQTIVRADKDTKQGKGRYVLEFGQKTDAAEAEGVVGTPVADTDDKSVELTIPNKTASNMAKGNYEAKITWSLVDGPK